jgi:hypothetical protein
MKKIIISILILCAFSFSQVYIANSKQDTFTGAQVFTEAQMNMINEGRMYRCNVTWFARTNATLAVAMLYCTNKNMHLFLNASVGGNTAMYRYVNPLFTNIGTAKQIVEINSRAANAATPKAAIYYEPMLTNFGLSSGDPQIIQGGGNAARPGANYVTPYKVVLYSNTYYLIVLSNYSGSQNVDGITLYWCEE